MLQIRRLVGYHVTAAEVLPLIERDGLLGSPWPEGGDFSHSCSDPFDLSEDGAVFCFCSLAEAEQERWQWDQGQGTVILRVEGDGVEFDHYAEGRQVAILASSAKWTLERSDLR